jgi:hypothetical protein
MRPPLSRGAPVARVVTPEPEPAPMEEEALPKAAPAPLPSVVASGTRSDGAVRGVLPGRAGGAAVPQPVRGQR